MIRASITFAASSLTLAGCTSTTSFAPPNIAVQYTGDTGVDFTCPGGGASRTTVTVGRTRVGTYQLIDTFIAAVRCSAHASANGRQAFEIPAFLATSGAAVAAALGGGSTYGIVGTGANAAFNAGNKYWDPKAKAAIYDHALDALLCIKNEAVGVDAFAVDFNPPQAGSNETLKGLFGMVGGKSTIEVPVEEQYFMLVSSAVFSVERVLAHRLSNVGTFDASSVAAELEKAIKAKEAIEKDPPTADETVADAAEAAAAAETNPQKKLSLSLFAVAAKQKATAEVDLAVLKPKLDGCVVLAKM